MKRLGWLAVLLAVVLTGCSSASVYKDGQYEGSAEGKYGPVTIELTISKDKIKAFEVVSHTETPGISDPAIQEIPAAILKNQSIEGVDVIAGVTVTSEAILKAAEVALSKAK